MPKRNVRGGKGFKKGRKDDADKELRMKFEGKEPGQQYGRITTALGNRRFKCFCDDGAERTCKLRGVLCWGPKRQRMEIGDIVLISARDFDAPDSDDDDRPTAMGTGSGSSDRVAISDIITKIPPAYWRDIRREAGIHRDFFLGAREASASTAAAGADIFDDAGDESGSDDGEDDDEAATPTIRHVGGKRNPKWATAIRPDEDNDAAESSDGGDIDVDAI
jgi:initiation factor 1A